MYGLKWVPRHVRHNCWIGGHFVWSMYADSYECERHQVRWYNTRTQPVLDTYQASQEWKRDPVWVKGFRLINHAQEHVPCP